ncbi:MAG: hypothetical protein J6B02_03525 [Selenomonadales bacterium]|nr:hypothetical protein [Selenomonadales bacterium]
MMWTVASPETWRGQSQENAQTEQVICRGGVWMSVMQCEAGGYRIRRILSTDPRDYLCESLSPGSMLR